jgi:hypothetical protein
MERIRERQKHHLCMGRYQAYRRFSSRWANAKFFVTTARVSLTAPVPRA